MKLARDFLYWLNHCSWHTHKHVNVSLKLLSFGVELEDACHLLCAHVEADVGRQHASILPAQRPDPQEAVVSDGTGQRMLGQS